MKVDLICAASSEGKIYRILIKFHHFMAISQSTFAKNIPRFFHLSARRFFVIGFLCFTLTLFSGPIALSQVPSQKDLENYYQNQGMISRLNTQGAIGNLVYAPVKLDGKILFLVAAPASVNQKKDSDALSPVELRVQSIEAKLQGILKRGFNPESLKVNASILNGQTIIVVSDDQQLTPQPILTITELDAQLHGRELSDIAAEAAKYIHNVLLEAWKERQPEHLRHQSMIAVGITIVLLITSIVWRRLQKIFKTRWQKYKEKLANFTQSEKAEQFITPSEFNSDSFVSKNEPNEVIAREKEREHLTAKIQQINFRLGLLNFGFLFLWLIGLSQILELFPYSRGLGYSIVQAPKELLFIGLMVFVVNRSINPLINCLFAEWKENVETKILFNQASARDLIRIDTLTTAIMGVKTFLVLAIGLVIALKRLGIPITPIVAGAGIVGFAVSFGSQNFIKSLILGASNFWLDAYAVGDSIRVENVSGTVEKMNLFFTQIRNIEGSLITIPNSRIEVVENKTRDWSQVNLTIQVDYNTDVDKALIVIRETADELYHDLDWKQYILEAPNLLGIDNLDHSGMGICLLIKTQPGRQGKVGRELRRRLRQQLEQQGINIGIPQQILNNWTWDRQ
ncbi:MAG: hypothetical protein RLZZ338_4134 [Cyanobacteriota bacterium]